MIHRDLFKLILCHLFLLTGHSFDGFLLEVAMAHDEFAEVLVLITHEILIVKDRALFKMVTISWWATSDDLTSKTGFVNSSVASTLNVVFIWCTIISRVVVIVVFAFNSVNSGDSLSMRLFWSS